jgi:hypothetical protein
MPPITEEMKEELGEKIETLKTRVGKVDIAAQKFHTLSNRQPTVQHEITEVKTSLADFTKRHGSMEVGGKSDSLSYVRMLNQINTANTSALQLEKTIDAETETFKEIGWKLSIQDTAGHVADISHFDSTLQGVLHKIVVDHGRGDHGDTVLTDKTKCKHWVSGSERIFGNYVNGHLVLIGSGRHVGSGNSSYDVHLIRGGTTKATTA